MLTKRISWPDITRCLICIIRLLLFIRFTCKPALAVSVLGPLDPRLVPGMCKVDEQDELDEDEGEGAHHAKVIPH